jgi:hypothetical protein
VARLGASSRSGGTRPCDRKFRQVCRVEARCSPTAIKTPGAVETKGSMRVIKDEIVDAPFFTNDGFEGSKKAGRRLATFKLHAGLDLENI